MEPNEAKRLVWPRVMVVPGIDSWGMVGREYQQRVRDYVETHEIVFEQTPVDGGWHIKARWVPKGQRKDD
jgi:hypothetical protein